MQLIRRLEYSLLIQITETLFTWVLHYILLRTGLHCSFSIIVIVIAVAVMVIIFIVITDGVLGIILFYIILGQP